MIFPDARRPRLRVLVNNVTIVGVRSAEIRQYSSSGAGSFALTIPLSAGTAPGVPDWMGLSTIYLSVEISLDGGITYVNLIEGFADSILVEPVSRIIHIEGRDLAAKLLATRSATEYQNRTSSEIAIALALAHGLQPVIAGTTNLVGRYYGGDHNILTLIQSARLASDWDLLVALAQAERFDVFVKGRSLVFQPTVLRLQKIQRVTYENIIGLQLERRLPLSQGINVMVKSWNSETGNLVSEAVQSDLSGAGNITSFSLMRPNLSSDEAAGIAQRLNDDLRSQAISIEFTMLGETTLTAYQSIMLSQTDTPFDRLYGIQSITRRFRPHDGFTQVIRANHIIDQAENFRVQPG